jgi:hypothetical protein
VGQRRDPTGVDGSTVVALEQGGVIAPKLFRRLVGFPGDTGRDLSEFKSWLASEKPEQLVDLDDDSTFTHLDNVIEVTGSQVIPERSGGWLWVGPEPPGARSGCSSSSCRTEADAGNLRGCGCR